MSKTISLLKRSEFRGPTAKLCEPPWAGIFLVESRLLNIIQFLPEIKYTNIFAASIRTRARVGRT